MQKCRQNFMSRVSRVYFPVNKVYTKVNRANAQSRQSGILFAQANGKLCFVQQILDLQHKTTCPHALKAGGRNALRSRAFQNEIYQL